MTFNIDDVAIQLVYLVAGMESEITKHRVTQRLQGTDDTHPCLRRDGHIGMVTDLIPYAVAVASHRNSAVVLQDFPGVFEYEVTEPLGSWLARTQCAEKNSFLDQLKKLSVEFTADSAVEESV